MSKLCERPGCSEIGAAEYGMVPEDLLFWIAPMAGTPHDDQNVLCLRHADAMSVPRGWTLDDRREEIPRLFMPRPISDEARTRRRRPPRPKPAVSSEPVEQLVIDGTGEIERPAPPADAADPAPAASQTHEADEADHEASQAGEADQADHEEAGAPWRPSFDQANDLDGLLEVSSPLLARAFRGTDRPRD